MAEVAGTIFGVISLSIQLFDKLNTYTNSVKDARTKAEQITGELDTLVNLLENLETIISRLDPTTSTALTRNSIQECARAVEMIRSRLGDVPPVKGSVRFWTRSRNVIKRLTYPFKESDIKYWKDVLASIQQSLQTALLVSHIDQQQRYFTTLQAQIDQLPLNTSAEIQMILDQQRYFQTQNSSYTTRQNQMCGIGCLFDQRLHDPGQRYLDLGQQDYLTPSLPPVSATQLESDMENLNYQRTAQPNLSLLSRGAITSGYCTCRGMRQEKRLLQRPVLLSLETQYRHDRLCPFWLPEAYALNVNLGFILSCLVFGLKLRILMALSIGAGTFSLTPSLTCSRIVSESSSPAFAILASMTSFDPSRRTLRKNSMELSRIFQTRQSSPHDRLENGQTLLHYFCSRISQSVWCIHPSELGEYRSALNQLLRHMSYTDAMETDDQGNTCVDVLLGATEPVDQRWKILVTDLLQQDLKVSVRCHPEDCFESYGSWVGIHFDSFADPFFGNHDFATRAALLRSEEEFIKALQGGVVDHSFDSTKIVKLYKMTTRMGWVPGCKYLLDAKYSYVPEQRRMDQSYAVPGPLLFDAIESQNQAMVQLWLTQRDKATAAQLPYIGHLEAAIVHASEACQQEQVAKMLVTHVIEQRRHIREEVVNRGIQRPCVTGSNSVLDVHTPCALSALDDQGFQISHSLRPSRFSVYNVHRLYTEQPMVYQEAGNSRRTFQMLYDAGFRDIQVDTSQYDHSTYCSPLIFATTGYRRFDPSPGSCIRFLELVDWFLSKGATLTECWPGSRTTALHCISAKIASLTWRRPLEDDCMKKIATILQERMSDDCKCSCSKHGCTGITSFWKGSYRFDIGYMADVQELMKPEGVESEPSKHQRIGRWELERLVRCVAAATEDFSHRWIITEFIRLCLFSLLGIRHACCNLYNIEHRGDPAFERQPLPRYSPAKSQQIAEEDEDLKGVLEKMVSSLDAQYDPYTGNLQCFMDELVLPQTKAELERLKGEDKAMFDVGRRTLGVVMVT